MLWRLTAAPEPMVRVDGRRIDSIFVGESEVVYGGAQPTPWLARWRPDGIEELSIDGGESIDGDYLSVRWSNPPWFALNAGSSSALYQLGAQGPQLRLQSNRALHGPIPIDGGWLSLADGQLQQFELDRFVPQGEVPWTCLVSIGGQPYACIDRGLSLIEGRGDNFEARPFFNLTEIHGPATDCPQDTEQRIQCERQWVHYAAEAGLLRADSGPPDGDNDAGVQPGLNNQNDRAGSSSGCAMVDASGAAPWVIYILILGLSRRRSIPVERFPNGSFAGCTGHSAQSPGRT